MQLFGGLNRIYSVNTTSLPGVIVPPRSFAAVGQLPDAELEDRLKRLAGIERKALVLLLAHLGEFDERKLHADRGHPSLFSYCMRVLGYSEQAAYKRIQAARAARAHPEILQRLADSALTLTAVVILSPHLRGDNTLELLDAARGRRTREVEALAAGLAPRPDSPDCLRALPSPPESKPPTETPGAAMGPVLEENPPASADAAVGCDASRGKRSSPLAGGNASRELIEPLAALRFLFRFTGSSELLAKFERARELLGTDKSRGPMEAVFEAGLDALLDKRDPQRRIARRRARTARPARRAVHSPASRRISAALRDAVWERDGGRCTYLGPEGERCPSTARLEIDHIRPYALGGASDDAANLRLMCSAHNQLLGRRIFGPRLKAGALMARNTDYPQG